LRTSRSPADVDHWKEAICPLRLPERVRVEIDVEVPIEEEVTVTE
jgi:hypothetical protein